MFKAITLAAMAVVMGACGPGTVRLQSDFNRSTYDHRNFTLYHGARDTLVVVHGNPFGMDPAAFAKAVTDNMQGANPGPRTNFTTTPGKSAEKNLLVVMAFNARVGIYQLCQGTDIETRRLSHQLTLTAAWCFDGRQDSLVEAVVGPAKGAGDPRFRALIRQTVLNLFPQFMDREFIRDNDDDRKSK
ncbi:MAG: hypothetical protein V3S59_06105 [Alphaproteobacteria bacterium]